MEKPIIEIKNISKKYNIKHQQGGYVALRDILTNVAKKPFSFLKNKAKRVIGKADKEEFWALKDINFEVQQGEVVGIIGANGAGKSTLLKILSQITPPTTGEIILRGKVGSLLEVGTGFHPELTGRENIMLNGAILGMTKKEIIKKFDDIIKFAGIDKFLDTPVKRYSSGMYVRLAFSVAAHMEPDILIIDEVLAVGDAEFQKKCLGKMDEITKKEGRTILFVSHNMEAIKKLCPKSILMSKGKIKMFKNTTEVIESYTKNISNEINSDNLSQRKDKKGLQNTIFKKISFYNENNQEISHAISGKTLLVGLSYSSKKSDALNDCRIEFSVKNIMGQDLFICSTQFTNKKLKLPSSGEIICKIENLPLTKGKYLLDTFMEINKQTEDFTKDAAALIVKEGNFYGTGATCPLGWEEKGILIKQAWVNPA